jgi:hypothetical protein
MNAQDEKELSRFKRPEPTSYEQMKDFEQMEQAFHDLAKKVLEIAPSSADRSAAMRYLRLSMIQVQMSIAHDYVPKFSVETVDAATLK